MRAARPGRKDNGPANGGGTDFILLDTFSTAFILTGSAEVAIQDTVANGVQTDVLKKALVKVRSGEGLDRAMKGAGMTGDLSEWISMVCSGSANDSQPMLDSWKAQALRCLAKVEDATSLVITFSSLLPVVMASLLLITGYGSSLAVFSIVFVTIAAYWMVSRWMKRLVRPLS